MTPVIAIHAGAGVLHADKPGARHRAVLKQHWTRVTRF
jgi:hypothetical protein